MTISDLCNYETIKTYILELGGFTDSDKLDLQIRMIINECLAYCYRKDVPPAMELPLADVVVSQINRYNSMGYLEGDITSYREGDMSISYGNLASNGATAKFGGKLEPFKQIIGVIDDVQKR